MSSSGVQKCRLQNTPNQEAYCLLKELIKRVGLSKAGFLGHMADRGFVFSDNDFGNWGRVGRSFPKDYAALRAIIQVVTQERPENRRCTAEEALHFLSLAGLPLAEFPPVAALFPPDEYRKAWATYMSQSNITKCAILSSSLIIEPVSQIDAVHAERKQTMSQITFDIPDETLLALKMPVKEASQVLRLVAAVKLFELGQLSSGAAAQLAGIPKPVFLFRLADYNVSPFQQTEEHLLKEFRFA